MITRGNVARTAPASCPGCEPAHRAAVRSHAWPPATDARTSARNGHATVLHPAGQLDASTCATLRLELRNAVREGRRVEVDLSEVTFMNSAGLAVLAAADRLLRRDGRRLIVLNPSPRVRYGLSQMGADRLLIREAS